MQAQPLRRRGAPPHPPFSNRDRFYEKWIFIVHVPTPVMRFSHDNIFNIRKTALLEIWGFDIPMQFTNTAPPHMRNSQQRSSPPAHRNATRPPISNRLKEQRRHVNSPQGGPHFPYKRRGKPQFLVSCAFRSLHCQPPALHIIPSSHGG